MCEEGIKAVNWDFKTSHKGISQEGGSTSKLNRCAACIGRILKMTGAEK